MKTLYIHLGAPKTGSTALQSFLETNSGLLLRDGFVFRAFPFHDYERDLPEEQEDGRIVFVGEPGASGKVPEKRNAYFLHGKNGEGFEEENRKRLTEGLELILKWFSEADHVILSDEFLWITVGRWDFMEQVKEFAVRHEITVKLLVYLRRQDDFLDSYYRQRIKLYFRTEEWEEFLTEKGLIYDCYGVDYEKRLFYLSGIVSKENIFVRPYEPSRWAKEGTDIYHDFADMIGLKLTDEYSLPGREVNPSQNHNYTEIQRIINRLNDPAAKQAVKTRQFFQSAGVRCSAMHPEEKGKGYWGEEERQEFMDSLSEGNRHVAETYLGQEELFKDSGAKKTRWDSDTREMQEDMILYFGELTRVLFQDVQKLKNENARLKRFSLGYRLWHFFKERGKKL